MTDLIPLPRELGTEILRSEVGSTLHGTGLPGGEDHDEMGIFVENPATTVGLRSYEQFEYRTANERATSKAVSERSQPGDTDLTVYTLRKWAKLALKGNPSVLLPLYAPDEKIFIETRLGSELRLHRNWFRSKHAADAFLGYMEQQRQRMIGERGTAGRVRKTPDGAVDWKYAMHMLRLGFQGWEYVSHGYITLPVPDEEGEYLRAVRRGEVSFEEVIERAEGYERSLKYARDGDIPSEPNHSAVEQFVIRAHLECWRG